MTTKNRQRAIGHRLPMNQIICGDCLEVMREWPADSIHCVVTSPPYWGLRDYGIEPGIWGGDPACGHEWGDEIKIDLRGLQTEPSGGIAGPQRADARKSTRGQWCQKCGAWRGCYGLEPTPDLYVQHTVEIFREVRRVLRPDGALWLNLGDSYNSVAGNYRGLKQGMKKEDAKITLSGAIGRVRKAHDYTARPSLVAGLKPKDLVGIPWRVAFALQADGWYLRLDIIWHKPNPMPQSVTDRCTSAHEYVFMLTKSPRYFYDAEAIREPSLPASDKRQKAGFHRSERDKHNHYGDGFMKGPGYKHTGRNKRSVWTVPTAPFKEAHFATFPPNLIGPMILAGTSAKGCCPQCGAPWKRVVDRKRVRTRPGKESKAYDRQTGHVLDGESEKPWNRPEVGNRDPGRHVTETRTIGWRPTCKCHCENGDLEPVPCVVLDPFGGSGTVGMVAGQERRDWILIDRNPKYCEMARRRTDAVMQLPLFPTPDTRPVTPDEGALHHV